jgi:hypothetical protein
MTHSIDLTLGERVQLSLLLRDHEFLGIGAVTINGVSMRDDTRPWSPWIRDPEGNEFVNWRLVDTIENPEFLQLRLRGDVLSGGHMEYMLHTVRSRMQLSDWSEGPIPNEDTTLELTFKPVVRSFGNSVYTGFSYSFRYITSSLPVYRILDRCTWEPNGSILGSQFWMRTGTVPSIYAPTEAEETYSTEWYLPGIEQPNIFQFVPFQGQMQGFTFTACRNGILVTLAREPAHIRSCFEKHSGKTAMFHWHDHCGDLSYDFQTAPMEVLWLDQPDLSHIELFNRWEEVRYDLWKDLNSQAGLQVERVAPYGVMEEWTIPDFTRYLDLGLPKLIGLGVQTIMIPNEFQNNMNVWGSSNMCCTVDWKLPDTVDADLFTQFCNAVKDSGGWVEMWGNTALSTISFQYALLQWHENSYGETDRVNFLPHEGSVWETIAAAKNPWVRNPAGHIESDHYTPVFAQVNFRDPTMFDYWMQCWRYAHSAYGVEGIFIDSSFNMSMDKFTFRQNAEPGRQGGATIDQTHLLGKHRPFHEPPKAIESQYHAYLQLISAMQREGYHICVEDVGVFGVSRSGPSAEIRVPALPMWVDSICIFDTAIVDRLGLDPLLTYFKGLAYRCMWYVYWDPQRDVLTFGTEGKQGGLEPGSWQKPYYDAYIAALPVMERRTILRDEWAVEYRNGARRVLWVFADGEYQTEDRSSFTNLLDGTRVVCESLQASALSVWLIEPSA